jgi:hypothetical protein
MATPRCADARRCGDALRLSQSDKLTIESGEAAELALSAGVKVTRGSAAERKLIQAVLDGQCSEAQLHAVAGLAGDLIQVLTPKRFLVKAAKDSAKTEIHRAVRFYVGPIADRARREAQRRLLEHEPRFTRITEGMRTGRGQAGTTSAWGDTAREIAALYGPCWLAAEIAVIGAAIPDKEWITGGAITKDAEPFGPNPDYGTLLQEARFRRNNPDWWQQHFDSHNDPLSRATWTLALVCVGAAEVLRANLENLSAATRALPPDTQRALAHSSSRIGRSGLARRLSSDVLDSAGSRDTLAVLLIAHHQEKAGYRLPAVADRQLADTGRFGDPGWPGLQALSIRMLQNPSTALLEGIRAHGNADLLGITSKLLHARDSAPFPETILMDPGAYPLGWVLAAERCLSHQQNDVPMSQVAQSGNWFPGTT